MTNNSQIIKQELLKNAKNVTNSTGLIEYVNSPKFAQDVPHFGYWNQPQMVVNMILRNFNVEDLGQYLKNSGLVK
jgi:hypothetical protein